MGFQVSRGSEKYICPVQKKCGGCQMLNLSYERQLSEKMTRVISLMGKFCHVEQIHGMDDPVHYRNKVASAFGRANGRQINGMYQSASHKIVQTEHCLLEDEICSHAVGVVADIVRRQKISVFDPRTGRGTLRHVLVRRARATGELMVVPVTSSIYFPEAKYFVNELCKSLPGLTTVVQVVNDTDIFLWLGEREKVLYGKGYIEDVLCSKRFRISPRSFYQINPVQTEYLYSKAIELAAPDKCSVLFDAYCGIGTMGIIASDRVKKVIGVESNKDAVNDAIVNAKLNGIKNIRFYCDDAGALMHKIAEGGEHIDSLITDPPRAGCSRQFLDACVTLSPSRIVYVSCNPETLARDCAYLVKRGYKVKVVQPVDMFPHTEHVETVCQYSSLLVGQTNLPQSCLCQKHPLSSMVLLSG